MTEGHVCANSGRFPVCAGPIAGIKRLAFRAFGTGSLGQVDRPLPDGLTRLTFTMAPGSPFLDVPAGYPKGISSVHHGFVETRKGVPTNWAGTPDALYVDR